MRKQFLIACAAVLAFCLLLLVFRSKHQVASMPGQSATVTTQPAPPKIAQNVAAVTNALKAPTTPITASVAAAGITNIIASRILALWQAPIDFYGKVIDQKSNPVDGVKIHFSWYEIPAENGERTSDTTSDAQGLFSLHNALGLSLAVSVSKDGFYTSRRDNDTFTYGSLGGAKFSPDPLNPVIFLLRKKGQGASLIDTKFPPGMRIAQLHHDGTPVQLDLLNGTQVSAGNGQLKIQFLRDISNKSATKFDWELQLSTPNGGGLIPTDEEFPFEAPQNGYQPSIVIDMPATNQDWNNTLNNTYYIQLPNGNYGRFGLYFLAHNGVFIVNSAINPTGSQNLEPSQ